MGHRPPGGGDPSPGGGRGVLYRSGISHPVRHGYPHRPGASEGSVDDPRGVEHGRIRNCGHDPRLPWSGGRVPHGFQIRHGGNRRKIQRCPRLRHGGKGCPYRHGGRRGRSRLGRGSADTGRDSPPSGTAWLPTGQRGCPYGGGGSHRSGIGDSFSDAAVHPGFCPGRISGTPPPRDYL